MRSASILLFAFSIIVVPVCAQTNSDLDNCIRESNSDARIIYCTRTIQSGQLSNSNLAIAFHNRGVAYESKEDYERAIHDYDEAIRLSPGFSLAFCGRGNVYESKGDYERAIHDYDEAIRLDPNYAHAFNNRGVAYLRKGDYDRATRDFREAIRLDPSYTDALNNLRSTPSTNPVPTSQKDTAVVSLNDPDKMTTVPKLAAEQQFPSPSSEASPPPGAPTVHDHLTAGEVAAALASSEKPTGFVYISEAGMGSMCGAQLPALSVYTPTGWIRALNTTAQQQYRKYAPTPDDTVRALTIIADGCIGNSLYGGLKCDSITRVALLSDKAGTVVVEATSNLAIPRSWQNGFGATLSCSSLQTRFMLPDVQKVRNRKGEFLVAVFGESGELTLIYTVKEKHLKTLGM